jgi:hypothetical protein
MRTAHATTMMMGQVNSTTMSTTGWAQVIRIVVLLP